MWSQSRISPIAANRKRLPDGPILGSLGIPDTCVQTSDNMEHYIDGCLHYTIQTGRPMTAASPSMSDDESDDDSSDDSCACNDISWRWRPFPMVCKLQNIRDSEIMNPVNIAASVLMAYSSRTCQLQHWKAGHKEFGHLVTCSMPPPRETPSNWRLSFVVFCFNMSFVIPDVQTSTHCMVL